MALCGILQNDFLYGSGRFDDRGTAGYDDSDLAFGVRYATSFLAEGIEREPLEGYDLRAFKAWCEARLRASGGDDAANPA